MDKTRATVTRRSVKSPGLAHEPQKLYLRPLEEWSDEELEAFEVQFGWYAPAMSQSQRDSFALGEPTDPPVAAVSRQGYSLDTSFIYPITHQSTTLRQQHTQGNVTVQAVPGTETSGGAIRIVTIYSAMLNNVAWSTPITYATYVALQKVENTGDDEAYSDGVDTTYTADQSLLIDHDTPKVVTQDRMSHQEPDVDALGRSIEFREDTRWPANPLTGEPNPDYP
jgi:hypothetical protein